MKEQIKFIIDVNFHLIENNKVNEFVEILYKFYINNNILKPNENIFWYDKDNNGFNIHDIKDTKECIKNDIEACISEERYEDTEPLITSYCKSTLYQNIEMTLEQYDYCL